MSAVDEPVGVHVLDGGGTDEPVAPVVVGPVPVLDGCPYVVEGAVVMAAILIKLVI